MNFNTETLGKPAKECELLLEEPYPVLTHLCCTWTQTSKINTRFGIFTHISASLQWWRTDIAPSAGVWCVSRGLVYEQLLAGQICLRAWLLHDAAAKHGLRLEEQQTTGRWILFFHVYYATQEKWSISSSLPTAFANKTDISTNKKQK